MAVGAWGAAACELLEGTHEHLNGLPYQQNELWMSELPTLADDRFCCWLLGRPEARGTLFARFGEQRTPVFEQAFRRALRELGENACDLLCGRFAIVTLDRERGSCTVTRDQLGAQPLVYVPVRDGLLFADHERELLARLVRAPAPDRLALLAWIQSGVIPQGRTLYEGISRLPAGHRLRLDGGHRRVERWWRARYADTEQGSRVELAAWLREESFAAIARAALGARRPAVKLSGGLDSACVAAGLAVAERAAGRMPPLALAGTFSEHPDADERELIAATASHVGLPLEPIPFAPGTSMLAPALAHIDRWRLPPSSPNLFLWEPLTRRAADLGVDVMLDGEGGDELFGIAPFLIADRLRAGALHSAWSLASRVPRIGVSPSARARLRVLLRYGVEPVAPMLARRQRRHAIGVDAFTPAAEAHALAEIERGERAGEGQGPLWWRRHVHSVIELRDLLGMGAHFDREARDAGLELRHPLLFDLPLIEMTLRLPPELQFDPVRDRPLLRDGLTGLIPEQVRARHAKSHFSSVVAAGLRAEEAALIEPLRRRDAPIRAYVSRAGLDRTLETAPGAHSLYSLGSLWGVAIANRWLSNEQLEAPATC